MAPVRTDRGSSPRASWTAGNRSSTSSITVAGRGSRASPVQTAGRRAAIATLLLGGGRASATGSLLRRDVDLANGLSEVGRDKTDAGMREVDMLPLLREIWTKHTTASANTGPDDPVFVTSTGAPRQPQPAPRCRRRADFAVDYRGLGTEIAFEPDRWAG
jgi:hypothetical protein